MQAIEDVNVTVATFQDEAMGDVAMYPEKVLCLRSSPRLLLPAPLDVRVLRFDHTTRVRMHAECRRMITEGVCVCMLLSRLALGSLLVQS